MQRRPPPLPRAAAGGARLARAAAAARAAGWLRALRAERAAAAEGRSRGRRLQAEDLADATEALSTDDPVVDEAYQAVATATALALIAAGSLVDFYAMLLFAALINIVPAVAAIHDVRSST